MTRRRAVHYPTLAESLTFIRHRESGVYPPQQFDGKVNAVPESQLASRTRPAVETREAAAHEHGCGQEYNSLSSLVHPRQDNISLFIRLAISASSDTTGLAIGTLRLSMSRLPSILD